MPASNNQARIRDYVISVKVDVVHLDDTIERIFQWAETKDSRYVLACNVHMAVTASTNPNFLPIVNNADLTIPDGSPIAWWLRKCGHKNQSRICGPDLMWSLCEQAKDGNLKLFLLGSTDKTLNILGLKLRSLFPKLDFKTFSPPFRPLTQEEDLEIINMINAFGTNILFVSLGCPKQEQWMEAHKGKINAVMIGVGAAFEFHAGTVSRAPRWMQRSGLEWLYRLLKEPRRLWKRYFLTNSIFIFEALKFLASKSINKRV